MKPLHLSDQRHLKAAEGWLESGNHLEANEELEQITPENRAHPAVLEIRWQIYAKARKWEAVLDIASALVQLAPEHPSGWVRNPGSASGCARESEPRSTLASRTGRCIGGATLAGNKKT